MASSGRRRKGRIYEGKAREVWDLVGYFTHFWGSEEMYGRITGCSLESLMIWERNMRRGGLNGGLS